MTIRDPNRDVDDLLGDDGGEIGGLYRRLPRYEPPRRLDRAVLGEAARAVHSGKPPRQQRWVVGLGSAAGLVLAAGIAWRVGHDVVTQNQMAVPAAAPRVVPVEPISESARAKREDAPAQQAQPAETESAPAPPSAMERAAGNSRSDELKSEPRKTLKQAKPAPPQVASPALAKPAPPPPAAPSQAFPDAARQREQTDYREKSNAPSKAATSPATRAGSAAGVLDKSAAAGVARTEGSTSAPSGSVELQRDMQLAPEDWLAHIRQLDRQGRRQQASESLSLFQRAHPDWAIPDDLRKLLDR
jgi:hypothetical protein